MGFDVTEPSKVAESAPLPEVPSEKTSMSVAGVAPAQMPVTGAHSPVGGVVAAFVAVALICSAGAWALYAFKNPHTRSGQLLIKVPQIVYHHVEIGSVEIASVVQDVCLHRKIKFA